MEVMNGSVTGSDPSSRGRHHGSCLPRELAGEISRERSPRLIHHPVRRVCSLSLVLLNPSNLISLPRVLPGAHTSTLSPLFFTHFSSNPFLHLSLSLSLSACFAVEFLCFRANSPPPTFAPQRATSDFAICPAITAARRSCWDRHRFFLSFFLSYSLSSARPLLRERQTGSGRR